MRKIHLTLAGIACIGMLMAIAAPAGAQSTTAPTSQDEVSQHHQLQYRMMKEMAYTPPPPVAKPDPRRLTAADVPILLGGEPKDAALAQVLVRRLRAISPQMGREIAFRVAGNAAATLASLDGDASVVRCW